MANRLGIALRSIRRESTHGWGHAATWFWQRFLLRVIRRRWDGLPPADARDLAHPLTVVVPAVEKDADVLAHCLRAVRRYCSNRIEALWVVAPESTRIRALAASAGAVLVPEDSVLPRPARELQTRGWVLQQLIKFNACHSVPTPDYLVLDADTILLRPQSFVRGGRIVLRYADQYELLYNRSLELVFGHGRRFPASFVTHHQVFQAGYVRGLLAAIEARFGRPWWQAILQEVDQGHLISFSEYEFYGHHVVSQPGWRDRVALEYWHGMDLEAGDLGRLPELQGRPYQTLNSVSFHSHTQ